MVVVGRKSASSMVALGWAFQEAISLRYFFDFAAKIERSIEKKRSVGGFAVLGVSPFYYLCSDIIDSFPTNGRTTFHPSHHPPLHRRTERPTMTTPTTFWRLAGMSYVQVRACAEGEEIDKCLNWGCVSLRRAVVCDGGVGGGTSDGFLVCWVLVARWHLHPWSLLI